jgi:transmembrane sensor
MESQEHIHQLIAGYLSGESGEADLRALLCWLQDDEDHAAQFKQLCAIWKQSERGGLSDYESDRALSRIHERISAYESIHSLSPSIATPRKDNIFFFRRVAAVAFVLVSLSVATYFLVQRYMSLSPEGLTGNYYTVMAPRNQKSRVILSDGTRVWLNCGSTLKYRTIYGEKKREVYLDGEAYFEVAKNPSRPFFVHASSVVVRAIGTVFNVKNYYDDKTVETTLVEGKVEITHSATQKSHDQPVILYPNEQAVYRKGDAGMVVSRLVSSKPEVEKETAAKVVSVRSVISWKNQELIFENESLEELVKRLERWYDVSIDLRDTTVLSANRYTGQFIHHEPIDQVLKIISRTTPVKYSFTSDKIIIESSK